MSLNGTPSGERWHIAIFGRRNVGKSSLINALTGQDVAIVSPVKGTTTDPVAKAMELPSLGPVVILDTPGLDDAGELGAQRVQRAYDVLHRADIAILVTEAQFGFGEHEQALAVQARAKGIPLLFVINKTDIAAPTPAVRQNMAAQARAPLVVVSAMTGEGMDELKLALIRILPEEEAPRRLVGDLLQPADVVVLVVPLDKAAPKGRLILPQQQTIRDILDAGAQALVTRDTELPQTLARLNGRPRLVITDSQVFPQVAAVVPRDVWLTSFSILFARYKGDLTALVQGARAIDSLPDGARVLVAEGCTHQRQCDDIGTVKIPARLRQYTGKQLVFEHSAGMTYPRELRDYALVVHCGGCMLNRREMQWRLAQAHAAGVPIVNYGVLLAHVSGILPRCLEPFQ